MQQHVQVTITFSPSPVHQKNEEINGLEIGYGRLEAAQQTPGQRYQPVTCN
jgi:hypothetical protein